MKTWIQILMFYLQYRFYTYVVIFGVKLSYINNALVMILHVIQHETIIVFTTNYVHIASNIILYYILSSNKGICAWPIWPEVNCPYFHTRENNRLLDYYKIISILRPILGLDFISGQCGCLFSRCRKYVINSLIHGHFHIGLVIIPRPISGQYGGLGMITRPIWKCPCINL